MINLDETISVLKSIIKNDQDSIISEILIDDIYPNYKNNSVITPDICKNIKDCKSFYKTLKFDSDIVDCPFGIKLKLHSVNASNKNIRIISQLSHDSDKIDKHKIVLLPRKSKKRVKTNIRKISLQQYTEEKSLASHNFLVSVLETMLYGRVATSMKGLLHSIFTPLSGIKNDLKLVSNSLENGSTEIFKRIEKNIGSIDNNYKQIQLLLSDNISFNRNMLRKLPVKKIINEIIEQFEDDSKDRFIIFKHGVNRISNRVEAIPYQFVIVLTNLIQNAFKYSFNGSDTNSKRIEINYDSEDDKIIIIISNVGTPITVDEIQNDKLFELGYRGTFSQDRNRSGTGTGLHIAHQITKAHGGNIVVESIHTGNVSPDGIEQHVNYFKLFWPLYQDS